MGIARKTAYETAVFRATDGLLSPVATIASPVAATASGIAARGVVSVRGVEALSRGIRNRAGVTLDARDDLFDDIVAEAIAISEGKCH